MLLMWEFKWLIRRLKFNFEKWTEWKMLNTKKQLQKWSENEKRTKSK